MTHPDQGSFCVEHNKGRLNWKMKLASAMIKQYRDITFHAVKNAKTLQRDGQTIFSLLSPSVNSPVGRRRMRFLFHDMVSPGTVIENHQVVQWGSRTPHIVSLALNYDCQCRCTQCCSESYREMSPRDYMTTDQVLRIMKEATACGTTTFILGGGEPLLRNDVPRIVHALDKNKATLTLFSNGEYLTEEKARSLADSHVYGVFVSLDSADPEKHDKNRKRPGLFKKALEAIENCKRWGIPIGISTVCTKDGLADQDLLKIIEIGKQYDVFEIFILDVVATGNLLTEDQVILTGPEKATVADVMEHFAAKGGYPNIVHESMLFKLAYPCVQGCPAGTIMMHIRGDGRVSPCDFMPRYYGNVKEDALAKVWNAMVQDKAFSDFSPSCRMNDTDFRDKHIFKTQAASSQG